MLSLSQFHNFTFTLSLSHFRRLLLQSMAKVYVTRRETFSSAHRLHSRDLSDEENKKVRSSDAHGTKSGGFVRYSKGRHYNLYNLVHYEGRGEGSKAIRSFSLMNSFIMQGTGFPYLPTRQNYNCLHASL